MLGRRNTSRRPVNNDADMLGRQLTPLPAFLSCLAGATIEGEVISVICHASPHRLPDLRLRYPVRLYRTGHDNANAPVARRVRRDWRATNPRFPEVARYQSDLVYSRLYHRELAARMRK